jgi:hypothetical protein
MESIGKFLSNTSISIVGVVVKPKVTRQHDRERCKADGVGESDEIIEYWDGFSKNKGNGGKAKRAAAVEIELVTWLDHDEKWHKSTYSHVP